GIGIIKERSSPGTAKIYVKAAPAAVGIQEAKALEGAMHTTDQVATIQYGLQTLASGHRNRRRGSGLCLRGGLRLTRWCFGSRARPFSRNNASNFNSDWRCGCASTRGKDDACQNKETKEGKQLAHDHLLLCSEFLVCVTDSSMLQLPLHLLSLDGVIQIVPEPTYGFIIRKPGINVNKSGN